eukprot:scaffold7221_cov76-Phaeocystis_antarctica.AAC.1
MQRVADLAEDVHLRDGGDAPPTPDGAHRAHARRPELPGVARPADGRVCAAARPRAAHHERARRGRIQGGRRRAFGH